MSNDAHAVDFGGRMKRLREERGVTLRDIAASTKVAVSSLDALERNEVRRLPGGIFVRAMVRSYASEIGADPEAAVRDFIAAFPIESVTSGLDADRYDLPAAAAAAARNTRMAAIIAAIVVSLAAILAWSVLALT
jgi:cytoskeleton protein RodZ